MRSPAVPPTGYWADDIENDRKAFARRADLISQGSWSTRHALRRVIPGLRQAIMRLSWNGAILQQGSGNHAARNWANPTKRAQAAPARFYSASATGGARGRLMWPSDPTRAVAGSAPASRLWLWRCASRRHVAGAKGWTPCSRSRLHMSERVAARILMPTGALLSTWRLRQ